MRITNIFIPKDISDNGLEIIKMDKIDRFVLIAGKNGSGKSRLIQTIKAQLSLKPTNTILLQSGKNKIQNEFQIKLYKDTIQNNQNAINSNSNHPQLANLKLQIEGFETELLNIQNTLDNINKTTNWNYITTDIISEKYITIDFVPSTLTLIDWKTLTQIEVENSSNAIIQIGIGKVARGALSYIQLCQNKWYNSTHQSSTVSELEKIEITAKYMDLKKLLENFLGTELDRDRNGYAKIFDFQLGEAQLSSGQKILLQLCVAIHAQNASLSDLIIFMDEPENHLHPSAVIEIIKKIEENVPNGQLWIATHSVPLLSYFDTKYLWFMENNSIRYAGRTPENVLNSLLGDEEQKAKLHNFMGLPSIYALNRFAHECLFDPAVLMTDSTDPQISQIRNLLIELSNKISPLKILDFGAGKGRLLSNVVESIGEDKSKFIEKYNYIAFDEYNSDKDECISNIELIYGSAEKKYFNSISKLFTDHDKKSFQVVVMCNVLHEIPVEEWKNYFGQTGHISDILADDGFLLLVEDNEMPVGEKAHQKGFLVIDTLEIKDLFCITEADKEFIYDDFRNDGRLKAHLIPKQCLTRMTHSTLKTAVTSLRKSAGEKIKEIRAPNTPKSFKNGMKHGYWVQIYANAQLTLELLD